MLQIKGIYEDGNITLLEDVPIKKRIPVIVNFLTEEKEDIDYTALDEIFGFCESTRTDASINHDKIIYGTEKQK